MVQLNTAKYTRQWFSQSPQVHSTVQSSCLREGKNRGTTRGTCLWESTRKRSKPYLLFYVIFILCSFIFSSPILWDFLTKVALSLSNFPSISSNPICNILPLVEHQLSIFIFCRTTFEVLVQGGEKEEKRTKETTKGGSRGEDQPRVRDSHHSGKFPFPCNPCAPKIFSPLKNPIFFVGRLGWARIKCFLLPIIILIVPKSDPCQN